MYENQGRLVLQRKRGQVVRIGHDVAVEVVEVRGNCVRLAFTAPDSVPIHRQEVFDAIQADTARTLWGDVDIGGEA